MPNNALSYEEWLEHEAEADVFVEIFSRLNPGEFLDSAFDEGVRQSSDPDFQAYFDSRLRVEEIENTEWWPEVLAASKENGALGAAQILIDHGYTHSPCCLGTNPECEFEKAMQELLNK
jgi:hypothetical protein